MASTASTAAPAAAAEFEAAVARIAGEQQQLTVVHPTAQVAKLKTVEVPVSHAGRVAWLVTETARRTIDLTVRFIDTAADVNAVAEGNVVVPAEAPSAASWASEKPEAEARRCDQPGATWAEVAVGALAGGVVGVAHVMTDRGAAAPAVKTHFGVELADCASTSGVPDVLHNIHRMLVSNTPDGVATEGIFRLACRDTEKAAAKAKIEEDEIPELSDAILLANLMKEFFRDMPTRLLSSVQESSFVALETTKADKFCQDDAQIRLVLDAVEEPAKAVLLWLLDVLVSVAACEDRNHMGAKNLGVVFGPNLVEPPDMAVSAGDMMAAMRAMERPNAMTQALILWRARTATSKAASSGVARVSGKRAVTMTMTRPQRKEAAGKVAAAAAAEKSAETVVQPKQRVDAASGVYEAPGAGMLIFDLDNSFAWVNGKTVEVRTMHEQHVLAARLDAARDRLRELVKNLRELVKNKKKPTAKDALALQDAIEAARLADAALRDKKGASPAGAGGVDGGVRSLLEDAQRLYDSDSFELARVIAQRQSSAAVNAFTDAKPKPATAEQLEAQGHAGAAATARAKLEARIRRQQHELAQTAAELAKKGIVKGYVMQRMKKQQNEGGAGAGASETQRLDYLSYGPTADGNGEILLLLLDGYCEPLVEPLRKLGRVVPMMRLLPEQQTTMLTTETVMRLAAFARLIVRREQKKRGVKWVVAVAAVSAAAAGSHLGGSALLAAHLRRTLRQTVPWLVLLDGASEPQNLRCSLAALASPPATAAAAAAASGAESKSDDSARPPAAFVLQDMPRVLHLLPSAASAASAAVDNPGFSEVAKWYTCWQYAATASGEDAAPAKVAGALFTGKGAAARQTAARAASESIGRFLQETPLPPPKPAGLQWQPLSSKLTWQRVAWSAAMAAAAGAERGDEEQKARSGGHKAQYFITFSVIRDPLAPEGGSDGAAKSGSSMFSKVAAGALIGIMTGGIGLAVAGGAVAVHRVVVSRYSSDDPGEQGEGEGTAEEDDVVEDEALRVGPFDSSSCAQHIFGPQFDLTAGLRYRMYVSAQNATGEGALSDPVVFDCPPQPEALDNLRLLGTDTTSAELNWDAPAAEVPVQAQLSRWRGTRLAGMYGGWEDTQLVDAAVAVADNGAEGAAAAAAAAAATTTTAADGSRMIANLVPNTHYKLRIRARGAGGDGPWSDIAFQTTAPGGGEPVGAAVENLRCAQADATSAELNWDAPATEVPVQAQISRWRGTRLAGMYGGWEDTQLAEGAARPGGQLVADLTPGTHYKLRLRSCAAGGNGPWSDAVDFQTAEA